MKTSPPGRGRAITEMIMTGGGKDEGRGGNEKRRRRRRRKNGNKLEERSKGEADG